MGTPKEILDLMERFDRNRNAYRSAQYNETQLRREFLDPFFTSLGWDVENRQGFAEAYKDVVHEDAIKVGGFTKAPDYCFRIGGTRKFFVEAKKPAVDIGQDTNPAFQLRANRWDEIAGVFSRESVLKGSFDKYAETTRKKGTAEVDDAFLSEIESWRDVLARNLALRNPNLSQRELNFSVPADKSRHDRMVQMVEQMLSFNKKLSAANTDHERTSLQRQIDATDRQIDLLVYELYGLTDEEIRIVEESRT